MKQIEKTCSINQTDKVPYYKKKNKQEENGRLARKISRKMKQRVKKSKGDQVPYYKKQNKQEEKIIKENKYKDETERKIQGG